MLANDYILPVNLSVINATTPPWPTRTTIISTTEYITSTTNHASFLHEHFSSMVMISFVITKYYFIYKDIV
jgi:hypothetical protein